MFSLSEIHDLCNMNLHRTKGFQKMNIYHLQGKTPLLIQSFKAPYTTSFSNFL